MFEIQNQIFEPLALIQLIQFKTWKRIVQNAQRESVLDHVYVKDPSYICEITSIKLLIGDHKLVMFTVMGKTTPATPILKRDWSKYSKELLNAHLERANFNIEADDPQSSWNNFEYTIMSIIDQIAPIVPFLNNETQSSLKNPYIITHKLNLRKRLIKN